ncbi:nucleotide exchange factor GrpE [Bordetella avium]|uniref:Protein GrpE n=1 Tax=Bordetella avium (strain 197N) TaxID=360910 RepID=GRPE_BORA1|nr:nucleotide exchange factor GrpE [Bordetella avium]Q2KW99.1 RecName: Full=Protein GrpE; AltName: Full=HSP-70 cofactor [Bordetella avium 197N]AZY50051.1 nucleotide exchange factor GrpE [Bordetella avium]AZY53416.1 nucleotide exchange factor GrpE [Bordetella avium]RIQ12991.1 nucleotide exchange factor GrpE [Bordetella avium]RIQ17408.1 nucleotide exchange factor GrpE [Bordetella avium]RIQ33895.1 nucleotide exchange factor GrpE [Bordetella avium]
MTAPQEPVDPIQDAGVEAPDLQAEIDALRAELAAAQAQAQAHQEQALRAMAEAENVRRRAQEDVSKARKFGIESFAESLVPVKDSLEAALAQPEQTAQALREGVEVTLKQLNGAFERNMLKDIAPAQGDKFDPHLHQAISSVPAPQPANTVVQLLQKGYVIADRTLRPALVVVSAGQG